MRRTRTNTPLQALTMLNDPQFFELAKAMAQRLMTEAGKDERERAIYAVRLCLSRRPKPAEVERVVRLYELELTKYQADPAATAIVVKDAPASTPAPQLAAWAMVSNVLMNLDEAVTKE